MDFKLKVNPEKVEAFLQLLRSWQSLGVVTEFRQELVEGEEEIVTEVAEDELTSSRDMAGQYRDLVD